MRTISLGVVVALCLWPPSQALAADEPTGVRIAGDLESELQTLHEEQGFHGALVFEVAGRIVLERGFGMAHRERNVAFTPETPAQIGSISKSFTALAALTLAAEGRVDLYAPVSTYLPGAAEPGATATLHQLMTHTAGLPEDCGYRDFEPLSRSVLLTDCLGQPLAHPTDSAPHYSNLGFSVVAAVVEEIDGQPLEQFVAESFAAPAGLTTLGFVLDPDAEARAAVGYIDGVAQERMSPRIEVLGNDWWALKGNGGLQASVRDMWRWSRALRGRGPLPKTLVETATMPRVQREQGLSVAYGWYVRYRPDGSVRQISHSGSDGVFFSYFWLDPRTDCFFYVVGSTGEEVGRQAARMALGAMRDAIEELEEKG